MNLPPFLLEDFFAKHEFAAPYTMGSSDPETLSLNELLKMADTECRSLWSNLRLSYTETLGLPILREEIASLYTNLEKDKVLAFSGAEEAIYITMQVLLQKGDEVIVITPCYQSLKTLPQTLGAKVTEVALEWKNSNWIFNLEKFAAAMNDKIKLVILNFPHNPTGFHPSPDLFKAILELVKKHKTYLFSDEVYRFSEYQTEARLPNAVDCYDKAFSLGVMSKSFGLPGLRLGWLATQDTDLLNRLAAYKNYTTICNSAPSEILALIALRNKEYILQRNLTIAQDNLNLLDSFFKQHFSCFEWYRPQAGFISFPRLKLNLSINDFSEKLIAEDGVIVIPGTLFDNHNNHFRLGFGRRNLPEALARLEKFTAKMHV